MRPPSIDDSVADSGRSALAASSRSLTDVTSDVKSAAAPSVDYDAIVVGAGPAGTAAAITLRRAGRSVLVVDKAGFPRDKCCGDGLTTLALRELEQLGLQPETVPNWYDVDAAWLRSPSGRQVCVPLPDTGRYAAVVPRIDLDHRLVELTRDAGADVRDGHAFERLDGVDDDSIGVVVTGLGSLRARSLIAADGMWSPVRKAAGDALDGYRGEWHAFRQYASNVTGPASDRLIVWFEGDLLPGYALVVPAPRQSRQHRLRRPARRASGGRRDGRSVERSARPAACRRGARA